MACAWAGFAAYAVSMLLSYFIGQRYYKIDYPLRDMALYLAVAAVLYVGIVLTGSLPLWASLPVNTLLIAAFVALIVRRDLPLASLPYVGRYFKKNKTN